MPFATDIGSAPIYFVVLLLHLIDSFLGAIFVEESYREAFGYQVDIWL